MSRSAVVTLVAWVALVGALVAVEHHYWSGLSQRSKLELAIVLGGSFYAASLAAVSIRRIVDPKLPVPILAWLVVFAFWLMAALGKRKREDERGIMASSSISSSSNRTESDEMGLGWAIVASVLALGLYAGGIALSVALAGGWGTRFAKPATPRVNPVVTAEVVPPVVLPIAPAVVRDIMTAPDLAAAIAFAKPSLGDGRDPSSAGSTMLVRYAATKAKWTELAVVNETSLELVEKDPASELGKRLCAAGILDRIVKQTVAGSDVFAARLVTKQGDALEVFAVGSSGDLVKRKPARFCGVVTGRLAAAGKTATVAVGMFDVPANKPGK